MLVNNSMKTANNFFSEKQKEEIVQAIKQAELNSSGEIRVHIETQCKENVLDRAALVFKKLNMHKTKLRNGVLIYLAVESRVFAIIGDIGLNQLVPSDFWDSVKQTMQSSFVQSDFTKGLSTGILMTGEKLKTYFPFQSDDVNELPDEISFKKF